MGRLPTRRQVIQAGGAVGACAGLGLLNPVLGQTLHTPEAQLDRWHRGICGLCGMGDPLFLGRQDGVLRTVKGDALSPVGHGRLCTRGMTFPAGLTDDRRTTAPLLRRDAATKGSDGGLEAATWEEALSFLTDRLRPLYAARPGSVALHLDEGLPCESLAAWDKLHRGVLRSPVLESGARLGSLPGLDAAAAATGLAGPTGTTEDLHRADLVLFVGADPAARQTTLLSKVAQCRRLGTTRVVLIDPRRTGTCGVADVHVRPKIPGTEDVVLRAMAHTLYRDEVVGGAMPDGLRAWTPERAAEVSGARVEDVAAAAEAFAEAGRTVSCFGHRLRRPAALFDLHVHAGRCGGGNTVIPLTEGANEPAAALLGIRSDDLPLPAWLDALRDGQLQGLVTVGGNLLPRLGANRAWREALSGRLLVACTPVAPTETTAWADLVLPMALPWVEERGCYISAERRVQLSAPGAVAVDVPVSRQLAVRLSPALTEEETHRVQVQPFEEQGEEWVWEMVRNSTKGRPHDLSGMSYELLDRPGGLLWPFPEGTDPGDVQEPASAHVVPAVQRSTAFETPPAASGDETHPLHLMTFTPAHHSSARELTGYVPELHYAAPRAWIEVSGRDASRRKLKDGSWVAVESAHGVLVARLWITDRVPRGVVAVPEGYGFVCDLEGGTDGRGEPESLASLVLPADGSATTVNLREPTEEEMSSRALRKA